jgi:hypothetical protein
MKCAGLAAALAFLCVLPSFSQTTDGLISGRVTNSRREAGVASAKITYSHAETNTSGATVTDASGNFALPLLPPGSYRVRVEAAGFQAQEIQGIEVEVSGRLELNFRLRPLSDIWEAGQYRSSVLPGSDVVVTFFGPDVDDSRTAAVELHGGNRSALETSISTVVSPEEIASLPLAARDVYATLVLQPGVAASTTTGRGLGLAVNGQRPAASNFLLDGVENNNSLVTGPLNVVTPESVQEYRISTSNFSAEFGRTAGFVADAVTRAGGSAWHGQLYHYYNNEALNANDLERNALGLPRARNRQLQSGFSIGGPLWKDRLFLGVSGEYLQLTSQTAPAQFRLPTPQFFPLEHIPAPANSLALQILSRFPAPSDPIDAATGTEFVTIARPNAVDRVLALPRVDYLIDGGKHRLMARETIASMKLPDFVWTPYKDFITPLDHETRGFAATFESELRADLANELRGSVNSERLDFQRRWPDLPSLVTFDPVATRIWLPGSPAFYGFLGKNHDQEIRDDVVRTHGRHVTKFGGGILLRQMDDTIDPGNFIVFRNYLSFYLDQTQYFLAPASRLSRSTPYTNFGRNYRNTQFFLFAQDSFAVTRRLTVDYGIRYENYGTPVNTGVNKDVLVQLGAGSSLAQRIGGATLQTGTGDQPLYSTDQKSFAPRAGFAYRLRNNGNTVLRGSYGIFYDRPFDNLWLSMEANSFVLGAYNAVRTNYLAPLNTIVPGLLANPNQPFNVPNLVVYQPNLRNGYAQDFFLGIQQRVTESFNLELNATGSLGRDLITTDVLNRTAAPGAFGVGTLNPNLPSLEYRGNQGSSDYTAFTAIARYRSSRLQLQASYTLSHSIDNQSDPLSGDFFNFVFTGGTKDGGQPLAGTLIDQLLQGGIPSPVAAFTRPFDSHGDRANSDFDQRHNLVGYALYQVPAYGRFRWAAAATRGWGVSLMGAVRSGFPYSVFAPSQSGGLIYNNRANLIADPNAHTNVAGGVQLLNPQAFQLPAAGQVGNTGRNAFRGPGLASMDFSISRSFGLRWLGEGGRLTFRADLFNALNHPNLSDPSNMLTSTSLAQKSFGVASYGRQDLSTGFPASLPLNETPRQIQLMLRVAF